MPICRSPCFECGWARPPDPLFSCPQSTRIISPKRDPHSNRQYLTTYYTRWAAFVCKSILPAVFCCLGAMYGACLSPFFNRMLGASYGGAMVHRQKNTGTWKGQRKSDSHNGSFRVFLASNIPLVYEIHWNLTFLFLTSPSSDRNNLKIAHFSPSVPAALVEVFQRSKDHVKAGFVQDQSLNTAFQRFSHMQTNNSPFSLQLGWNSKHWSRPKCEVAFWCW